MTRPTSQGTVVNERSSRASRIQYRYWVQVGDIKFGVEPYCWTLKEARAKKKHAAECFSEQPVVYRSWHQEHGDGTMDLVIERQVNSRWERVDL